MKMAPTMRMTSSSRLRRPKKLTMPKKEEQWLRKNTNLLQEKQPLLRRPELTKISKIVMKMERATLTMTTMTSLVKWNRQTLTLVKTKIINESKKIKKHSQCSAETGQGSIPQGRDSLTDDAEK